MIIIHLNFCQVLKSELFFFQYIIIPPIIMIADPNKLTVSGNELKTYSSDQSTQPLLTTLSLNPAIIPKIGKAEAFYQQSNVQNWF